MAQAPLVGFRTEIPNYSKKDPGHWTLTPRNTAYDPKHSGPGPPHFISLEIVTFLSHTHHYIMTCC